LRGVPAFLRGAATVFLTVEAALEAAAGALEATLEAAAAAFLAGAAGAAGFWGLLGPPTAVEVAGAAAAFFLPKVISREVEERVLAAVRGLATWKAAAAPREATRATADVFMAEGWL